MIVFVGALVALLPLLAVLQYRWLGEVSRAERERMQASLKTAAAGFTRDFDGEVTRSYMTFQMDARTLHARDWQNYARQYDQWSQTAPHPQLADAVYLVQPDDGGLLRISRFDRASVPFARGAGPASLGDVKSSLEETLRAERLPGGVVYRSSSNMIDDQAPALVIPIPDVSLIRTAEPKPPLWFAGHVVV